MLTTTSCFRFPRAVLLEILDNMDLPSNRLHTLCYKDTIWTWTFPFHKPAYCNVQRDVLEEWTERSSANCSSIKQNRLLSAVTTPQHSATGKISSSSQCAFHPSWASQKVTITDTDSRHSHSPVAVRCRITTILDVMQKCNWLMLW